MVASPNFILKEEAVEHPAVAYVQFPELSSGRDSVTRVSIQLQVSFCD